MKLTDRVVDVVIGSILGITLGLHYDFASFKLALVALSVVGGLKLVLK